jgi:hypothetical protein
MCYSYLGFPTDSKYPRPTLFAGDLSGPHDKTGKEHDRNNDKSQPQEMDQRTHAECNDNYHGCEE